MEVHSPCRQAGQRLILETHRKALVEAQLRLKDIDAEIAREAASPPPRLQTTSEAVHELRAVWAKMSEMLAKQDLLIGELMHLRRVSETSSFREGDRVMARDEEGEPWKPGTVVANAGGRVMVRVDGWSRAESFQQVSAHTHTKTHTHVHTHTHAHTYTHTHVH
eukprot:Sspe_Gene.10375::Locus_3465_Transcript_1_8_Confidence_0.632_Length_709::g.10375::m.10375